MLVLGNKLTLNTQPTYHFVNKNSIDFDGVDDVIVTDGADTVAQPTTYAFWCKASTTGNNLGVFGHGSGARGSFHINFSGKPLLELGANYFRLWNDNPAQDDGEWHHWVVYSDTNDITNSKLYIDSVLQTVSSTTSSGTSNSYTESLNIGGDKAVSGNYFDGQIDEFAVFDRELTQEEITRMYNTYYSPNRVANGNFSQIGNEEVSNGDFSQIGSELVTNGDFATDSDWTKGIGWTIANNLANFNGSSYSAFRQNVGLIIGKIYEVTFDLNITSGNVIFQLGGAATAFNSSATHTFYETATDNGAYSPFISLYSSTSSIFSIDNVSCKEVGQDWIFAGSGANQATIGLNSATITSVDGNSYIGQNNVLVSGKNYKVTYTINSTSGSSVLKMITSLGLATVPTTVGTHTVYGTATITAFYVERVSNGMSATITDISVKEIGQGCILNNQGGNNGWRITDTNAICDTNAVVKNRNLNSSYSLISGKDYKLIIDILQSEDNMQIIIGSTILPATLPTGTNLAYEYLISGSNHTGGIFAIYAGSSDLQEIDNIVLQELKHDATNLMLNAGAYQSANPLITSTNSMEFDGTDEVLTSQADNNAENRTYSFWAKTNSTVENFGVFGHGGVSVGAFHLNSNNLYPMLYLGSNFWIKWNDNIAQDDNKWHNWIVYLATNLTDSQLYIDGVLQTKNTTLSSGSLSAYTQGLNIGGDKQTSGNYFDGLITEFGTWDRELTPLEVASLYNQGMPTNLLVNRNDYQSGNPTVFNTKQVDFDGVDDYMQISPLGLTGTFTYSFWYKGDGNPDFLAGDSATDTKIGFLNSAYFIRLSVDGDNTIALGTLDWNHLVVTRDSANKVDIYVNGGSANRLFSDAAQASTVNLDYIGRTNSGLTQNYDGQLSQAGVWNSTLTADEVSSLYNHGLPVDLTTNQAAYTSSSNLVGYWRMGSGTLDSYPLIADQTNATLSSELVNTIVNLTNPFPTFTDNGGGSYTMATTTTAYSGFEQPASDVFAVQVGEIYKLTFDFVLNSGALDLELFIGSASVGSSYGNKHICQVGFNTAFITITTSNSLARLVSQINSVANMTISNIVLKKVNGNPAIMTNQTASDIENGSPYANIVQNSDFSEGTTDWALNSNWSISNGTANADGTSNSVIFQSNAIKDSTTYSITYTLSNFTQGSLNINLSGSAGVSRTSAGTYTEIITSGTSPSGRIDFQGSGDFIVSVDNVYISEVNTGLQGYWKMGSGINDEYPVIYDQTNPTNGAELVTNGDFATDSDWTLGTGATISNNLLNFDNVNNDETRQLNLFPTPSLGTYEVSFDISNYVGGHIDLYLGGYQRFDFNANSNGTWKQTCVISNPSSNNIFYFIGDNFTGSIDNVSVKEVQGNPATMTNMVEGNITNQYPLTKIRNYYRMGDGILDKFPIIQDQTSPNLAHIPTTNLVPYSQAFSTWFKANITVIDNFATSPIGTTTASKLTESASASNTQYRANITITSSSAVHTISTYVKRLSGTRTAYIDLGVATAFFNFDTESIYSGAGRASFESAGNGWYRIKLSHITAATASCYIGFGNSNAETYTSGAGGAEILFWGVQVEEQSQATAYLPSYGVASVRKATTTNLLLYSEDFSQSYWIKAAASVTSGFISPDGTANAYKLVEDTSTGIHRISVDGITVVTEIYSVSIYVKPNGRNEIRVSLVNYFSSGTDAYFNLDTKVITLGSLAINGLIETLSNGWFRCSFTSKNVAFAGGNAKVYIDTALNGSTSYTGDGTSGVYIYGAQLEQQTQVETYAPTFGLPVTIDLFTENNYGTMINMTAGDIVPDTPNN